MAKRQTKIDDVLFKKLRKVSLNIESPPPLQLGTLLTPVGSYCALLSCFITKLASLKCLLYHVTPCHSLQLMKDKNALYVNLVAY